MNQSDNFVPPPNLFLLLPEHRRIVLGESRTIGVKNEDSNLIRAAILLAFVILGFVVVFLFSQIQQQPTSLSVVLLLPILLLGAGLFLVSRRFTCKRELENRGTLILGSVVEARRDVALRGEGNKMALRLRYEFVTPANRRISKEEAQLRDDLSADDLPHPGTPVAVMYTSDTCYRVL
jgi:hypothetical protein